MKREFRLSTRREFFGQSAAALALLNAIGAQRAAGAPTRARNPFAYDVSRLEKTDPLLLAYEEAARWTAPHSPARRLALAPDGRLFVCSGNYVSAVGPAGEHSVEIALSAPPECAAVAEDGAIFVGLREHVEVFDANGRRRASWDAPSRKSWLTALAVNGNDVFAADAGQRVLLRYDRSGRLLARLGEKNKERGIPGFIVPSPFFDVKIAPDGLLRVTNPGRHRVELYTPEGDLEGAWGAPSMGIAGFCGCCNPISLALLSDGRYVTCEKGLPRVKVYSAGGELESVVAGVESFPANAKACGPSDCTRGGLDAVADAQGRIYILDRVTGEVRVMKRKG